GTITQSAISTRDLTISPTNAVGRYPAARDSRTSKGDPPHSQDRTGPVRSEPLLRPAHALSQAVLPRKNPRQSCPDALELLARIVLTVLWDQRCRTLDTKGAGTMNLAHELAALPRQTVATLRGRYAEVFGEATRVGNKAWLVKRIAWRLQALAEGDLSARA